MRFRKFALYTAALLAAVPALAQNPGQAAPTALSEVYKDWTVNCANQDAKQDCAFSQSQANGNGQRILTIEVRPTEEGGLKGNLVLPFGLRLERGATFAVDDLPPGAPARFRTCLPIGCVVPLIFVDKTVKSLRDGKALKVVAVSNDGDKEIPFSISLQGFKEALDRTIALTKPK
ncbi:invasion associated locus B family protein [Oryzifoliimicrobium ureilyticus]|uniref:invasion associated locus B family protein n=1 Tax=Oryzifoliimicrobium ureilyticus TaxID=3113724 RepID=UPI0030764FA2